MVNVHAFITYHFISFHVNHVSFETDNEFALSGVSFGLARPFTLPGHFWPEMSVKQRPDEAVPANHRQTPAHKIPVITHE